MSGRVKLRIATPPALASVAALLAGGLPAPARAAAPQGLIREIPVHANIVDIARGPDGALWFSENMRERIGRITAAGKLTRFRLPAGIEPGYMTEGPGGVWFTYESQRPKISGGVGRITPRGKQRLFPLAGGSPEEIVRGPDGNLWVDDITAPGPGGEEVAVIARITPAGKFRAFSAGLRPEGEVRNLTAGPGGLWFGDESEQQPAIGRVSTGGEITEYPGIEPGSFLLEGPTPGPGGVFFSFDHGRHAVIQRIGVDGRIRRFRRGLSRRAWHVGPFLDGPGGKLWFRVERKVPRDDPRWPHGRAAIGRLDRAGRITEFSHCLRPLPGFGGPQDMTLGPEGNVWFVTRESGVPGHAGRASTPSIGRVTPGGRITEFRDGLQPESEPEELTLASGRLWFLDRRTESIGELRPPRRPANTFLVSFPDTDRGVNARIVVPGPGTVRLAETGVFTHGRRERVPGLGSKTLRADDCGSLGTPLPFTPELESLLLRRGAFRLALRITFRPRGGTPFSERTHVGLIPG